MLQNRNNLHIYFSLNLSYNQAMIENNLRKRNIIAISGKQYSGKDTLAKLLLEDLKDYKRIGIGDAIKIEYGRRNNLSFEEIEKNKHLYRDDLIKLGNWGRSQDDKYWLKNLIGFDKIIVPDVRIPFEVDFLKQNGAFLIRVESSFEARSKRGIIVNADDNTEVALDIYNGWDIVVYNNSTLDDLINEKNKVLNKYLVPQAVN